jgi:hypothetical protein
MNHSFEATQASFDQFVELSSLVSDIKNVTADKDVRVGITPKITLSPVTGKIRELRLSKSLIRQLIYKGEPYPVCPLQVYHTLLLRDITLPESESMLKGMYFESKCIGSSAGGKVVDDLPRHKKTGAKLSDHERIDQAIIQFQMVVNAYGLIVDPQYTQIYRKRLWADNGSNQSIPIYLEGTLDFISPITTSRYRFDVATIDLKLTKDREASEFFTNGLYHPTPWGSPEKMDFTEAMLYRLIFEMPFVYLVFDYKKDNPGFKDIPIITDIADADPTKAGIAIERMSQLYKTLRLVTDAIFRWEYQHWPMEPNTMVCGKCPIPDCPKRMERVDI